MMNQGKGGEFIDTGTGSAILHGNPKDTFQILFDKGQPFANEPILDVLNSLKDATTMAIDFIEGAL